LYGDGLDVTTQPLQDRRIRLAVAIAEASRLSCRRGVWPTTAWTPGRKCTLREVRQRKQLSQDTLARKEGITREYVNQLEAGRYDPTVSVLKRLAKAIGVPVAELRE
jgi:DNA-binding XRE family transcriptional regulator